MNETADLANFKRERPRRAITVSQWKRLGGSLADCEPSPKRRRESYYYCDHHSLRDAIKELEDLFAALSLDNHSERSRRISHQPPNLLSIPTEIRLMILRELLSVDSTYSESFGSTAIQTQELKSDAIILKTFNSPSLISIFNLGILAAHRYHDIKPNCTLYCAVLRTCRQLYSEGRRVLYLENPFAAVLTPPLSNNDTLFLRRNVISWKLPSISSFYLGILPGISTYDRDRPHVVLFPRSPPYSLIVDITPMSCFLVRVKDLGHIAKAIFLSLHCTHVVDDLDASSQFGLGKDSACRISMTSVVEKAFSPWLEPVYLTNRIGLVGWRQTGRNKMSRQFEKHFRNEMRLAEQFEASRQAKKAEMCYSFLLEHICTFFAKLKELKVHGTTDHLDSIVIMTGLCMYHLVMLRYQRAVRSTDLAIRRELMENVGYLAKIAMQLPSTIPTLQWKTRLLLWTTRCTAQRTDFEIPSITRLQWLNVSREKHIHEFPPTNSSSINPVIVSRSPSHFQPQTYAQLQEFPDSGVDVETFFLHTWYSGRHSLYSASPFGWRYAGSMYLTFDVALMLYIYSQVAPDGKGGFTNTTTSTAAVKECMRNIVPSENVLHELDSKAEKLLKLCDEAWGTVKLGDEMYGPLIRF